MKRVTPIMGDLSFLHFCQIWYIYIGDEIGYNCRYAQKTSYLGKVILAEFLYKSQLDIRWAPTFLICFRLLSMLPGTIFEKILI